MSAAELDSGTDSMAGMEVTECPSCSASEWMPIGKKGPSSVEIHGGVEFTQFAYEVRECKMCALNFKSHRLTPGELGRFYSRLSFAAWESDELFPSDELLIEKVGSMGSEKHILDYGCSVARVSRRFAAENTVYGYEIDKRAAAIASEAGLIMFSELKDVFEFEEAFDTIIMMDVFEHLEKPMELLEPLTNKLKTGGRLLILTGDSDSEAFREMPAHFWYTRPLGHLCFLNKRHGEWICNKLNLKVEEWNNVCHYRLPLGQKLKKTLKRIAYVGNHQPDAPGTARFLSKFPPFSKARNWKLPDDWSITPDHVLAIFRKL